MLSGLSTFIWLLTALLPWLPWSTRESLASKTDQALDLSAVTVVIPARNEADVIISTLQGLSEQGTDLHIILVDDESTDGTAAKAQSLGLGNLQIICSQSLPNGWTGKLWAQEQGLQAVQTPLTLLLDADILLKPGILASLIAKRNTDNLQFASLMAMLKVDSFWEKMLMPAFIYFFKMLYPFALANKPESKIAAAAGGCILVDTSVLHIIGGLAAIKDAVIDDCTLAREVKQAGHKTWIGLSHDVVSQRPYLSLTEIWDMVARTAYTQLLYSKSLLLICTLIMSLMYLLPLYGLVYFTGLAWYFSVLAMLIMLGLYLPTLQYYALNRLWTLAMPVIAGLYLLMTWTSAIRYWRGERSRWKGRVYHKV